MLGRAGHPQDMEIGDRPDFGVCAAVDVHYPRTGGARAAAVLAADPTFAHALAERTAVVPQVPRPLFVTAAGIPAGDAADLVRHMVGLYRLPDALRRADTLARAGPSTAT
jgi:deoxyinosine 3'endonuclease (endonuclease V)